MPLRTWVIPPPSGTLAEQMLSPAPSACVHRDVFFLVAVPGRGPSHALEPCDRTWTKLLPTFGRAQSCITMSTEISTARTAPLFSSQWFVDRSSGQPTPGP